MIRLIRCEGNKTLKNQPIRTAQIATCYCYLLHIYKALKLLTKSYDLTPFFWSLLSHPRHELHTITHTATWQHACNKYFHVVSCFREFTHFTFYRQSREYFHYFLTYNLKHKKNVDIKENIPSKLLQMVKEDENGDQWPRWGASHWISSPCHGIFPPKSSAD